MPSRTTRLLALCLCLPPRFTAAQFPSPSASLPPASQTDPLARLAAAHDATNLTDPALKPWHMLANFDLLDPKGAVTEHGTYEEWWAAPDRWKVAVTSPSYTATETQHAGKLYRTQNREDLPYTLELLRSQAEAPVLPADRLQQTRPAYERKKFGQALLDCIMLTPDSISTKAPIGFYTTYCLDPDQPSLRLSSNFGTQVIARNREATFQNKFVALEITVSLAGAQREIIHIQKLSSFQPSASEFDPTPDQSQSEHGPLVLFPANVLAGRKLGGNQPVYPVIAKQQHISGQVVLRAAIGKDGRVFRLIPIVSPDHVLTTAALDAVRSWRYQPFLLNGEAVEVETTVTINFNFGP